MCAIFFNIYHAALFTSRPHRQYSSQPPILFSRGSSLLLASTLEAEAARRAGGLAASASRAGSLGGAARVHSRAGNGVAAHLSVDVDLDTGLGSLVGTRELDGGRGGAAASGDGELVARHVWLSTASTSGRVEGKDLCAQQVVTGGDVGGDLDVDLAAALVEVLGTPEIIVAAPARRVLGPGVLVDLEPAGGAVGGGGVADLCEVGLDGAVVVSSNAFRAAAAVTELL